MAVVARPAKGRRLINANIGAEQVAMVVAAILAVGLVLYPLAQLVWRSIFSDVGFGEQAVLTLHNYQQLLTSPALRTAIVVTIITSIGTTVFSIVAGTGIAWATARTNMPGARILETLNIIPFFLVPFVGAVAWTGLAAGSSGILNKLLMQLFGLASPPLNVYSVAGMVWVMSLFYIPYVSIFVVGSFHNMDPALEEAARLSGASNWKITRHITLPLAMPAILSGALLVLVTSTGSPDVPLALGHLVAIDTLSTLILTGTEAYPQLYGLSSAVGVVLLAVACIGVYLQRAIILPRSFVTVTGKGYRSGRIDLGRWRYAVLGFDLLYLLMALVLPLLILIIMGISTFWSGMLQPKALTAHNFTYVLFDYELTKTALKNSLILAIGGATVGVVLCTIVSYVIYRSRVRGRALLDFVVMLPIAVPAIVLAMGILLSWIRTPLYGTLLILFVGYITRYMPIAQRNIAAALLAVGPELEECARLHGASWLRTMRTIIVPLLKPGLAAAWLLLFIIFIRELGVSVLLYGQGTEVMSVVMYRMSQQVVTIASFAIIQTAILLIAVVIFQRFAGSAEIAM